MPLSESILASCVEPGHLATMSKILQAALNTICTLMLWKFFLLTKTASSSDGAIILTCVPSITPTTPGNPAMSINALLCLCKVRASSGNETNCVTILGCDKAVSVWVMTQGGLGQTQVITAALLHFPCCQIPQGCDYFLLRCNSVVASSW